MLAHQIPVILGGGFDPSVIFAEMPGAWFEPRIGYMWQENTSVTATTSGGQTIGLLFGLDQQKQLGPNIASNSGFDTDISGVSSSNQGILSWYNNSGNGELLVTTGASTYSGATKQISGLSQGKCYQVSAKIRAGTYNQYPILLGVIGISVGVGSANPMNQIISYTFQASLSTHVVDVKTNHQSAVAGLTFYVDDLSVREILGNPASQSTVANRPTLQYANGLPLVRCDNNDFMTVSLPAINVRRNLLLWSEDFSNGSWTQIDASATKTQLTNTSGSAVTFQGLSNINKETGYFELELKYVSARYAQLYVCSGVSVRYAALFDLVTGQFVEEAHTSTRLSNTGYSIVPTSDGYYRASVQGERTSDAWYVAINITNTYPVTRSATTLDIQSVTVGAVVSVKNAHFSEVAYKDYGYQKITDWTSEQFSSSGSVYFALPTGMSALHGQSIGTSYSAPIQSMDLYGAVIVPSRLSGQREAQLQTYFEKLAGLR